MRRLACLALVSMGCARSLNELVPFPCAQNGECPGTLVCTASGCDRPRVDAVCATKCTFDAGVAVSCDDTLDCGQASNLDAGLYVTCSPYKVCAPVCTYRMGGTPECPSGHTCVGNECLVLCGGGGGCPEGTECHDLWIGGAKACMPAIGAPPACREDTAVDYCPTVPKPPPSCPAFIVDCGGVFCPEHSTCGTSPDGGPACNCANNYAPVRCDGTVCDGPCDSAAGWTCQTASTFAECDRIIYGYCHCTSGATVPNRCDDTCENQCRAAGGAQRLGNGTDAGVAVEDAGRPKP